MASQHLKRRAVVSSLIFRFPHGDIERPQVALFRRSDKVSTYRHHLAPISGSIENDETAIEAAWRELREETTLTSQSLALWRTGKAFTFRDESVQREWTVHPFAFRLKTLEEGGKGEQGLHIDWEHEGWQWHDPADIVDDPSFPGVPRLVDTLRRVYFEKDFSESAARALAKGLRTLMDDHVSGSRQLTTIALQIFKEFISQMPNNKVDEKWWDTVRMGAWHLSKNGRPSMSAAILNGLLTMFDELEETVKQNTDDKEKFTTILSVVDRHIANRAGMTQRIKNSLASYLRSKSFSADEDKNSVRILTVSSSSTIHDTILDAFADLDAEILDLRILESRPLYEGATLAASLVSQFKSRIQSSRLPSNKKLQISLYTDASAVTAADKAGILLLGADRISSSGGVCNKIGSLPAVLGATYTWPNLDVVVLTETDKISPAHDIVVEENDPREVTASWRTGHVRGMDVLEPYLSHHEDGNITVDIKNIYFEWVPLRLINNIICEDGILDTSDIETKSKQIDAGVSRIFGEL